MRTTVLANERKILLMYIPEFFESLYFFFFSFFFFFWFVYTQSYGLIHIFQEVQVKYQYFVIPSKNNTGYIIYSFLFSWHFK